MLSCCFHLKYMIIVKVRLRMVLISIMVSSPIFPIDWNKWQIELKFHHQLLYWLNLVQCLEMTLILVLLKNSLDDCSIISTNCLVATHVLILFLTGISTIVWKIWLETDEVMALSCYLMMTPNKLVSLMIPSWRTMTIKERLNLYCADKFQSYQEDNSIIQINQIIRQPSIVIKGESILSDSTLDESISINIAEEAHKKLVARIIQCVRSGVKQCIVWTVDTDMIVSLIASHQLTESFDYVMFTFCSVQSQTGLLKKLLKNLARKNLELSHSFMHWQGPIFLPHFLIRISEILGLMDRNIGKRGSHNCLHGAEWET